MHSTTGKWMFAFLPIRTSSKTVLQLRIHNVRGETRNIAAQRPLIVNCSFGDLTTELIRYQLIEKTNDPRITKRLIMDPNTPTLAKALIQAYVDVAITETTLTQRQRQTTSSWRHQDKLLRYKQSSRVILNVEATTRTYVKHVVIVPISQDMPWHMTVMSVVLENNTALPTLA